jgi:hypothetical protein
MASSSSYCGLQLKHQSGLDKHANDVRHLRSKLTTSASIKSATHTVAMLKNASVLLRLF